MTIKCKCQEIRLPREGDELKRGEQIHTTQECAVKPSSNDADVLKMLEDLSDRLRIVELRRKKAK